MKWARVNLAGWLQRVQGQLDERCDQRAQRRAYSLTIEMRLIRGDRGCAEEDGLDVHP